jgi:hypothetical protein
VTDVARARLALLVALLGWLGLMWLIQNTRPDPAEQVLFLALLFITAGGTAAVLVRPIHRRFTRSDWLQRDPWRAEREGALLGVWLVLVAWLRMRRTLDWGNLVLLAGVVALLELAVLLRRAP